MKRNRYAPKAPQTPLERVSSQERDRLDDLKRKRDAQWAIDIACDRVLQRAKQETLARGERWPPPVIR